MFSVWYFKKGHNQSSASQPVGTLNWEGMSHFHVYGPRPMKLGMVRLLPMKVLWVGSGWA